MARSETPVLVVLTEDVTVRDKLRAKLEEYRGRVAHKTLAQDRRGAYKVLVLHALLSSGSLNVPSKREFLRDTEEGFQEELFNEVVRIIAHYNENNLLGLRDGTGF